VNARTGKQGPVAQAHVSLDQVGAFVLGAVLNEFDPKDAGYGYYASEYDASYATEEPSELDGRRNGRAPVPARRSAPHNAGKRRARSRAIE
jgi:hypothetical protein